MVIYQIALLTEGVLFLFLFLPFLFVVDKDLNDQWSWFFLLLSYLLGCVGLILAVMSIYVCPYCLIHAFRSFRQQHRKGGVKYVAWSIIAAIIGFAIGMILAVMFSEMIEGK